MASKQLVWLITGTSSGLGRDLTIAALKRGDKVIATARARSIAKLADLKEQGADILELDVTAPLETLHQFAKEAIKIHGRVDVLVNNAGWMEFGCLEENTHQESYEQFNTNVFAPLNMNRAFLPYMRERKSGTIVWMGSVGGWRGIPTIGLYCATKYAVRALSEAQHAEISPLGLRSICFELGYYRTSFLTADNRGQYNSRIADYKDMTDAANARFTAISGNQPGDPQKAVQVMLDVVRGEGCAAGKPFPTVLVLGTDSYTTIKGACEKTLEQLEEWKEVSTSTDLPKGA